MPLFHLPVFWFGYFDGFKTLSNISRFENGNSNPSLEFLQKMAACLGKTLHITFE